MSLEIVRRIRDNLHGTIDVTALPNGSYRIIGQHTNGAFVNIPVQVVH